MIFSLRNLIASSERKACFLVTQFHVLKKNYIYKGKLGSVLDFYRSTIGAIKLLGLEV